MRTQSDTINEREAEKNGAANARPKQKRCFYSARFRVRAPRVCVRLNARVRDVTVQFSTCIHNYAIIRFPRSIFFFAAAAALHFTQRSAAPMEMTEMQNLEGGEMWQQQNNKFTCANVTVAHLAASSRHHFSAVDDDGMRRID